MACQRRFQVVELTRHDRFHQFRRDRFLAGLVACLKRQCQVQLDLDLDLQRRAQLGHQYGDRFGAQERLRLTITDGTATEQPMDVVALAAGDAIEREDVGTRADFYHRPPPQVIAQFWMARQDHRKT